MQVRHVGIVCRDLKISLNFYCNMLGFTEVKRMVERHNFISSLLGFPNVEVETVKLAAPQGATQIELLFFRDPPSSNRPTLTTLGLTHIALQVANLHELYGKLAALGIQFISPPLLSDDKKASVAFCQDPEGNYLELVELLT